MRYFQVTVACVAMLVAVPGATFGGVIEVGELNIINDPGNPSNGLSYLDMIFSDGLSQAAAVSNSQATYPDARLATPSEFDDLFAAAGIAYNGPATASSAFAVGSTVTLSNGTNYDGWFSGLGSKLGATGSTSITRFYTIPDGSNSATTTRDYLNLDSFRASAINSASQPPWGAAGWLIVSDTGEKAVPEPTSLTLAALALLGMSYRRRKRA